MPSSQHPQHSAPHPPEEPPGGAPGRGALEDLIARTRGLRQTAEAVRDAHACGARDEDRVRRALWGLVLRQLDDARERLEQLAGLAPPAAGQPAPAGRARLGGRMGTAEWSLLTDEVSWTDELLAMFGRTAQQGPLTLDELPSCLVEDDQPALTGVVTRCLVDGQPAGCEFRVVRPDGSRRILQLAGEPVLDEAGGTVAMWALVRDVSQLREEPAVPRQGGGRGRSAEGHGRLRGPQEQDRAEHRLAISLQRMTVAPWLALPETAGRPAGPGALDLAARYLPAGAGTVAGGKWFDAMDLPAGGMVLTAGDLSGRGLAAVSGSAMALGALRGIALTGASPGAALGHLGELLDSGSHPVLAAAVCCRYLPETRTLTWAQAGHPAPVLCRDGAGRPLPRPAGPLLGSLTGAVYQEREHRLEPGDVLVLHTDGLFPGGAPAERDGDPRLLALAAELSAAHSAAEALRLIGEACGDDPGGRHDDACVLVARVTA
ncbi:PP2C family protein-serine/threonine phosphatase [Streptomyces sp. YIM 98790]|uniref:PP2C family protein-serine/threonine phosphatase n=1 Tax=Streptomyces sp. YIM 98790 TaxID=2689077 RepID=UPI00140B25D6|nr:SpoIIE family protein phosphatase [Streptomyces sp. YIM 98790]